MKPISGAKSTVAKYCAELKMADAVPRSRVGNQAATIRALPGKEGASARPTRKRSPNRTLTAVDVSKWPTRLCRRVNSDHRKMPAPYTRFEPNRSSSQPPGIWPST